MPTADKDIASSLRFGAAVGDVLRNVQEGPVSALRTSLQSFWVELLALAAQANVELKGAAAGNVAKVQSRWPATRDFAGLFDDSSAPEEQLPRTLTVEFHERRRGDRIEVLLRYQGITIGDRLTDNIADLVRFMQ